MGAGKKELEKTEGSGDVGFPASGLVSIGTGCSCRPPPNLRLHPDGNVIDMAAAMGIDPLTEEQYFGQS